MKAASTVTHGIAAAAASAAVVVLSMKAVAAKL
jgi:hypothetical protein